MPRSSDVGTPGLLLDPPATPQDPRYPLKADENYQFNLSDAEVDRLARTQPHGHVTPNDRGIRAKCSGVRWCGVCRREQEILDWAQTPTQEKMRRQMDALRRTSEYRAVAARCGDERAPMSGRPLIRHVEDGMVVLLGMGAPVEAILAYCLHPLCLSDDNLAAFDPTVASTPTVLMYAMEFRSNTRSHTPKPPRQPVPAAKSPLAAVYQMLRADMVLDRLNFEAHQPTTSPYWHADHANVKGWLTAFGVDEGEYERLVDLRLQVLGDGDPDSSASTTSAQPTTGRWRGRLAL